MNRCALTVVFAMASIPSMAAWDLRNDFSLASNPNGAWTYGSTITLGSVTPYLDNTSVGAHYQAAVGTNLLAGWSNGGSPPIPYVAKNFSASTYFGTWNPTDVLFHPRFPGIYTLSRWQATVSAAQLSVSALFRRLEGATSNPSDCYVLRNGVQLSYGQVVALNQTHSYNSIISVSSGDAIDFVVGAAGADAGTGVVVDGSLNVVPEPSTAFYVGVSLLATYRLRSRRMSARS